MMTKRRLSVVTLLILSLCFAQTNSGNQPNVQAIQNGVWEYLVISFGRTVFSSPITDPQAKVLSKVVTYSDLGVVIAYEAQTIQKQMDTLGRYGWELVGIVGQIGGDQQMVFKRPYNAERSKLEAELIRREAAALLDAERRSTADQQQASQTARLVNLDEVERQQLIATVRQKNVQTAESIVRQAVTLPVISISSVSSAYNEKSISTRVTVKIDLTSQILQGNTYRSSAATSLLSDMKKRITSIDGFKETSWCFGVFEISLRGVVRFNNEWHEVASVSACIDRK